MKKSDTEIKQAVVQELQWDTRVDENKIGVSVDQGIVTLVGTVSDYAQVLSAEKAAHRVADVLDVANELVVRAAGLRTDADIAASVRHALESHVLVPERWIRSTVSDGWVQLEGEVDYFSEKEDAEESIQYLPGVRGITNAIQIRVPKVLPHEVRKSIEEAIMRHAHREAMHLSLDVHDGRVTVAGVVPSLAEKRAVLGAARQTPGVRFVEDLLRIGY